MRTTLLVVCGLLLAAPVHAQIQVPEQAPGGEQLWDRVVAVVGDTVLLYSDVYEAIASQSGGQIPQDPVEFEAFASQTMDRKISDLILVTAARAAGLTVSEEMINEEADRQLRAQQQRFGSEMEFTQALAQSGLTRSQYRQGMIDMIRDEQLVQEYLRSRLASRARPMIDESDIRAFFESQRHLLPQRPTTVSLRQVVVVPRPSAEARQAAIARAQEVVNELRTGADFSVLARRLSDDPGTAEHGGELGWFQRGRMVPEFETVAFSLRPGQTSGIVETEFGFHIIRVDRQRGTERQARHILIRPEITESDIAAARVRADSVATAVRGGESIAALATRYNPRDASATLNAAINDLEAHYGPDYGRPIAAASVGDLVGPVRMEDPRGDRWAVVRITERVEAGDVRLEDLRDQIRDLLQQELMVEQLLIELRQQVFVDVRI